MFRLPFTKDKTKTVKPPVTAEADTKADVTETTKVATKAAAEQAEPRKKKLFRLPFGKKD